jgi:putative endonuclease
MRRPVKIVFTQECEDRSDASKKEYAIKKLTRKQKVEIIE